MKYSFYVANNQSAESCLNRITFDSESKNGEVQLCDKLPQGVQFIAHNSVDKKYMQLLDRKRR